MSRLVAIALCLPLPIILSGATLGQEAAKPVKKASVDDHKKLAKLGSYTGKLAGIGPKSVTFHFDDTEYLKKLKVAQALPNAAQQKAAVNQVEAQFANVKWALGKDFEFEFADRVALRKQNLPFEYDDKGNPKKYTSGEMAKLKGIGGLPGYVAKHEDFTPGAMTTATFGRSFKDGKPTVSMLMVDNK
jgi:hypothetical protein